MALNNEVKRPKICWEESHGIRPLNRRGAQESCLVFKKNLLQAQQSFHPSE